MRKKLLSILLSVCMVLTLLPTVAFAAETTADFGDFSVIYDGTAPSYSDSSGTLTFNSAGTYTVAMKSGHISTSNVIVVSAAGVTLNLNGVTITAPTGTMYTVGGNALTVTSGSVTLNVIANSSLTGGVGGPGGMEITPAGNGGSGVIGNLTATGTATLTVTGGTGGPGMMGPAGSAGKGITGTITVGEGFTVMPGTDAASATAFTGTSTTSQYVAIIPPASPTLLTAADYAAASPAAASGTDYVLDDTVTPHTFTIFTAKGAAFWSANGTSYLGYTIKLADDIDVSAFQWMPVGNFNGAFTGNFDGQGHSISGLTVNVTEMYDLCAGLFGNVNDAMIQNLCIASGSIRASNTYNTCHTGSLVGYAYQSTIINCGNRADVYGANTEVSGTGHVIVGGLVGSVSDSTIINSYSTGNVCAIGGSSVTAAYACGLVGSLSAGSLVNCYNTGALSASEAHENYTAGLAGWLYNTVTVTSCYYQSSGSLTGFGDAQSATATVNGCGTFDANGVLTAGTADQFQSAQTLAFGTDLLTALNGWVSGQASTSYYTWQADNTISPVNGGYPVFGSAWAEPQAQWGVAGAENAAPATWVHSGSLTDAMTYANTLDSGTAYIRLLTNVDITATLEFAKNKTTILDLNGKTLDGDDIPTSSSDNNVLTVNGNLTLCDTSTVTVAEQGKITGGHGTGDGTGGGVYVDDSGFFIMTGGNITGNTAMNGGGVGNRGTFTMSGGSIAGNSCISGSGDVSIGGGVANSGEFNMSGGSITDNTVVSGGAGGGVLTNEGMTLSGNVNISGNTVGEASDNVALMPYSGHASNIYITGALTNSTAIGVSIVEMTEEEDDSFVFTPKAGIFTAGDAVTNSAYLSKFVSDNSGFAVVADGSQLKLAAAQAITKTAATNGSFTVKVNGNEAPSAIEGQTVTVTPTANATYELDTITVTKTGDTSTTVSVSSNTFTMPAYAVTVNVTFKAKSANTGGTGSGSSSASSGTGAPVIVDGKTQNIGKEKKAGDTTTVTVDQSKLGTNIGGATSGSSVVVPVSANSAATASLVVKNIEDMAAKSMTLTVQTGGVAYNLNTSAIDTAALTAAFSGVDMSKVPFDVTIANSSVSVEGETLVLSPVAFTITATHGGKTVDVDTFSAYIDRVIEVTAEQAAKITTAVVVNADGSVRHVPTNVIEKDGKYYAVINSRTNSTYALIQNEVTFADAKGKWFEAEVNEMGSRKIIAGRSASVFDGDAGITRAEFIVILVRALGLPADGASTFSDVPAGAWYTGAVATAVKYGLTEGRGDNQFDPTANITRQEAILMLQSAAALTEFTGTSGNLDSFADTGSVGSWALDAAKWSVGSGLIQGADGKLNPTAQITRAESATIILRLLQKAGLVDVRSKA